MHATIIEQGKAEDIEKIFEVYTNCTNKMLEMGINQWKHDYPTQEILLKDIEEGNLFLIKEDSTVAAVIVLDSKQDEQYKSIHWRKRNKGVLVIHRLAVNSKSQGKGYGKMLCKFAEDFGLRNDYKTIRLDAYSANPISTNLYLKLGYNRVNGYCYFRQIPKPFYCYEKSLEN